MTLGPTWRMSAPGIRRRPLSGPIVPGSTPIEEATARIIDAAGKGKLALLVTDAAGNVIVGLQATGGLTELCPDGEGRWLFAGALTKPEVLEGSVVLRNRLGLDADQEPDDSETSEARATAGDVARWFEEEAAADQMLSLTGIEGYPNAEPKPYQRPQFSGRRRGPDNSEPEDESEADAFEVVKRYIRVRYGTAQQAIEQWRLGPDWYRRPTDE